MLQVYGILSLSIASIFPQFKADVDLQVAYEKSYQYERLQDYKNAIKSIAPVAESNSQDYFVNVRLGWLYYLNANYANSRKHYLVAIRIAPRSVEARLGYLLPLLAQGRYEEAEVGARQALKIDPNNYYANLRLAFALRMQKKYEVAAAINGRMLELYPNDVSFLTEMALAQQALGEEQVAGTLFRQILARDPENVTANHQLGLYAEKKKLVVPDTKKSVSQLFNEGSGLYWDGEYESAVDFLLVACDRQPDSPLYHYMLALCQYDQGNQALARNTLQKALELERSRPIHNWYRVMERSQGPARTWLEKERQKALKED